MSVVRTSVHDGRTAQADVLCCRIGSRLLVNPASIDATYLKSTAVNCITFQRAVSDLLLILHERSSGEGPNLRVCCFQSYHGADGTGCGENSNSACPGIPSLKCAASFARTVNVGWANIENWKECIIA